MSFNFTVPNLHSSAPPAVLSGDTAPRPQPSAPLPSPTDFFRSPPSAPPAEEASRFFATPPEEIKPATAAVVSRAIGPLLQPQTTAAPRPSTTYTGQPAGTASSSSIRAALPVAPTPPGPIQTFPGLNNNCGNDCWANSLLQMMATVPSLQAIAYELGSSIAARGDARGNHLFAELQQLMTDRVLNAPISSANSNYFRLAIRDTLNGAEEISPAGQEDAAEALRFIMTNYDEKIKRRTPLHFDVRRTKHFDLLPQYADGRNPVKFSPINRGNTTAETTVDSMIMVDFGSLERTLTTLTPQQITEEEIFLFTELMWNYFDSLRADAEVASYVNPETGRLSVYKQSRETVQFRAPPEEFILSLKRFVPTGRLLANGTAEQRKIQAKAPLLERFTLPASYAGADATYEVDSFGVHSGGLGGGHYISYQKIDGNWYYFSDSTARPATNFEEVKDALQNSYFQHYQKLPGVDRSAFRLPTREEAGAMRAAPPIMIPPSAPAIAAKPVAIPKPNTTSSGRVSPLSEKDLASEKMMQLIVHKENLETLQKAIASGESESQLHAIFDSLPSELRENLITALTLQYGKPLAEKEIQSQPGYKNDITYGAMILSTNTPVLLSVLQKYALGQMTLFPEIFSREELKKIDPLIQAALSKNEQTMTLEFNRKDFPVELKRKLCQLVYQADVIEKAEKRGLNMIFSKEIALLGKGILAEAIEECNGKILSYSLMQ